MILIKILMFWICEIFQAFQHSYILFRAPSAGHLNGSLFQFFLTNSSDLLRCFATHGRDMVPAGKDFAMRKVIAIILHIHRCSSESLNQDILTSRQCVATDVKYLLATEICKNDVKRQCNYLNCSALEWYHTHLSEIPRTCSFRIYKYQ